MTIDATQFVGLVAFLLGMGAAWHASLVVVRQSKFWRIIAALQLAMAIEVVVQSRQWIAGGARALLRAEDLYEVRQRWQEIGLALLMLAIAVVVAGLVSRSDRKLLAGAPLVSSISTGLALLLFGFEAVSLHAIDAIFYERFGILPLVAWFWMAAVAVHAGAVLAAVSQRNRI